jgi:GTP-binding protein
MADIPGLIEGAHEGRGIGDKFLAHVERCAVLLHLVDITAENPVEDWQTIIGEIGAYGGGLADKPRITALSKIDAVPDADVVFWQNELRAAGAQDVRAISSASGQNVTDMLREILITIRADRAQEAAAKLGEPDAWKP